MKRFASLCLISALAALPVVAHADSMNTAQAPTAPLTITGDKGTVLKDNVNVRTRPEKKAEVLTQLKKGDVVDVRERKGEWLQITAPAHAKCFVASKLLKDGAATTDGVNVRSGPGENFHDIGKLSKGEKVEVVGTKGEWTHIRPTPNCTGWVFAELVEVTTPTPPPAPIQTSEAAPLPPPAIPAPAPVAVQTNADEIQIQYVVKDGYLAIEKDPSAPAPYTLMTPNVMGRDYIVAYLKTTQTDMGRFEGKHVRILGTQRWKRSERYPVIDVERCEMVW